MIRQKQIEYLKAYYEDLKYQLNHSSYGISFMNSGSSGTPYFETHEEAEKYVETLDAFVRDLETDQ